MSINYHVLYKTEGTPQEPTAASSLQYEASDFPKTNCYGPFLLSEAFQYQTYSILRNHG